MAYRLAGLRVVSEFALPTLAPLEGEAPDADTVWIRSASVPTSLGPPSIKSVWESQWDGERLLVNIAGTARYLITREAIDVEPEAGASPADVQAFLLGTVIGGLCHMRGIFPLHASGIEV